MIDFINRILNIIHVIWILPTMFLLFFLNLFIYNVFLDKTLAELLNHVENLFNNNLLLIHTLSIPLNYALVIWLIR